MVNVEVPPIVSEDSYKRVINEFIKKAKISSGTWISTWEESSRKHSHKFYSVDMRALKDLIHITSTFLLWGGKIMYLNVRTHSYVCNWGHFKKQYTWYGLELKIRKFSIPFSTSSLLLLSRNYAGGMGFNSKHGSSLLPSFLHLYFFFSLKLDTSRSSPPPSPTVVSLPPSPSLKDNPIYHHSPPLLRRSSTTSDKIKIKKRVVSLNI